MSYTNYPTEMNPQDQRMWSTLVHALSIFTGFWAPLIGFLVLKDRGRFVRGNMVQSLNFQLTLVIAGLVGGATSFLGVGFVILAAVAVLNIVFPILAALAANRGEEYTYPLTIPFLR